MASIWGQACWAKMTSLSGKQTALVCHPTNKVNKAEELPYLSANIGVTQGSQGKSSTVLTVA
jgi:hypothetical protein